MSEEQLVGADVNSLLQAKKKSRFFSRTRHAEQVGVGLFLAQLLGWFFSKVLGLISFILAIFLGVEKVLINLRVDTLQLFYWGRGNVFGLFLQAIGVFILIAVAFSFAVGRGVQGTVVGQLITEPAQVYAATTGDTIVEIGSLITNMPKEIKRSETIEYVVTYDDTLGGKTLENIASDFEVTADSIRWANNYTTKTPQPKPGTRIKIPPLSGSLYMVLQGDTIDSLSARFKIDKGTLVETNFLLPPYKLKSGQTIFLINTAPVVTVKKTTTKRSQLIYGGTGGSFTPPIGTRFLGWPVPSSGRWSRCYSSYHNGIDIMPASGGNPPVVAAAAGRVVTAGYKCDGYACGYAWRIEIDHGNGFKTLYGHLNGGTGKGIARGIGIGSVVEKGQEIGYMGSSGWSTGTHLHFTLFYKGVSVNPAPYMADPHGCK